MTEGQDNEAKAIPARLLDITGDALMSGDFERFAPCFSLPNAVSTVEGCVVMETREEMRAVFEDVHAYYASKGVTRLDRTVEFAVFDGPDMIRYSHISRLWNGETLVQPVYTSNSVIERRGDDWQVIDSKYSFKDRPDHTAAMIGRRQRVTQPGEDDDRQAFDIFQNLLDRITRTYIERDFDLLVDCVQLPLFMQRSDFTKVLRNVDEMRADFDRQLTAFTIHDIRDLVRLVKSADFIGAQRIQGTYRTHALRGAQLVIPSYVSAMTMEQGEDRRWRATTFMHPMGHLTLDRIANQTERH